MGFNSLRIDKQTLCKVLHLKPIASRPMTSMTLFFSSLAAFFVNDTAIMLAGFTPESISSAIRYVIVTVLPDPGPDRIKSGPSLYLVASNCSLFSSIWFPPFLGCLYRQFQLVCRYVSLTQVQP